MSSRKEIILSYDINGNRLDKFKNEGELVRCKYCKHWIREMSNDGKVEFINFSHCELGYYGDGHNWFCPCGERKDT